MSRVTVRGTRWLAIAAVFSATANAQQAPIHERAPVPRQVLTARTAFIGNAGGETYGAESYFNLTKYDGGPNRAYDAFYNAVREWGHYELVSSTANADVLLVIRFANPVVDRENSSSPGDLPHDWIYDPQLRLSINDPRTGLALWSITEHIEPANARAAANRHFDEAVTRLVDDLQRLILDPDASVAPESVPPPPGALLAARRKKRGEHAFVGLLLGGAAGALVGSRTVDASCGPATDVRNFDPSHFDNCFSRGERKARNQFIGGLGGAIVGAFVGWMLPTRY
jgi:hypothetical protein